ncbi:MAG: hypothetical protein Q9227_007362 [Pyrenula ochraceoflavens]
MRLLNTTTKELEQHPDLALPPYAILSHKWEEEEITFEDISSPDRTKKKGFKKISAFCDKARLQGLQYGWADTCCINKANSSELAEAINSMFMWYTKAEVCLAYLADVCSDKPLRSSEWFQRGWTLQAPSKMRFYDKDWQLIGDKRILLVELVTITGIAFTVLEGASPSTCSIAQRMSWASNRKTTRIEDQAYSLLGIFNVNLPMIYGEGEKAFLRLQEEIIKHSDDHSIFTWSEGFPDTPRGHCGLLAHSPAAFAKCKDIIRAPPHKSSEAYTITNKGLSLYLPTQPWAMRTYLCVLDCTTAWRRNDRIGILLEQLSTKDQYARVRCGKSTRQWTFELKPVSAATGFTMRRIYVRQSITDAPLNYEYGFLLRSLHSTGEWGPDVMKDMSIYSRDFSDPYRGSTRTVRIPDGSFGTAGIIHWYPRQLNFLKVGFDDDFTPVCFIGTPSVFEGYSAENLVSHRAEASSWSHHLNDREWAFRNDWLSLDETDSRRYAVVKGETDRHLPKIGLRVSMATSRMYRDHSDGQEWKIWTVEIYPFVPAVSNKRPMRRASRLALDYLTYGASVRRITQVLQDTVRGLVFGRII